MSPFQACRFLASFGHDVEGMTEQEWGQLRVGAVFYHDPEVIQAMNVLEAHGTRGMITLAAEDLHTGTLPSDDPEFRKTHGLDYTSTR
jgi:hypothetical protein